MILCSLFIVIASLSLLMTPYILRLYHSSRVEDNLNRGRLATAAAHLEWLFAHAADDVDLCLKLTDVYLADDNAARAEYTLIRGIRAEAGRLELYKKLCAVYLSQDKLSDAVAFLDELPDPLIREHLEALRPAPPALYPPVGRYEQAVSLELRLPDGADGYLTFGGQASSMENDLYTGPHALPVGVTEVKAVAVRDGLPSTWVQGSYWLENIVLPMEFADPTLESVLRGLLPEQEEPLMSSDLWHIDSLISDTEPMHYSSLDDLAHLQGLTELSLYGDGAKLDITPLAGLTHLKSLTLRQFALDSVDLAQIANWTWLEELSLPDNRIADIDAVAALSNLTTLDLAGNHIADASPLSDLMRLTRLDLSRNELTDTAPLAPLIALSALSLSQNHLTDLRGLRTLTRLETLDISYNDVSDLSPLANHAQLTSLLCKSCPIQSLEPLGECRALENLTCTGGRIESAQPLSELTGLRELCLDDNELTSLTGLETCALLESLRVNRNRLTSLEAVSGLGALTEVAVEGNLLTELNALINCPSLTIVYAYGNPLEDEVDVLPDTSIRVQREQVF